MNKVLIIMAGGLGKRMNSDTPKVLLEINSKPIIVKIISECLKLDVDKIIIVVGIYEEIIKKTIYKFIQDINRLYFIRQEPPLGTGHAILCCLPYLQNYHSNTNICILSGDCPLITSSTINKFFDDSLMKIGISYLENPSGYGRIIEVNNRFNKIVEEKDCSEYEKKSKLVNAGIYMIKNYLLLQYIPLLQNINQQSEYYLPDIFNIVPSLLKDEISYFNFDKYIQHEMIGVNTQKELILLENHMKEWDYDPPYYY